MRLVLSIDAIYVGIALFPGYIVSTDAAFTTSNVKYGGLNALRSTVGSSSRKDNEFDCHGRILGGAQTGTAFIPPIQGSPWLRCSTSLNAKAKKGGKKVPTLDFDLLDEEDEPMSKKDRMKAEKAAKKAAKSAQKAAADEGQTGGKKVPSLDLDLFAEEDESMSKKDRVKAEKAAAKAAKAAEKAMKEEAKAADAPKKKDPNAAALKALAEMEREEARMAAKVDSDDGADDFGIPKKKLSKKEEKMAKKKAEKEAAKKAAKAEKMKARRETAEDDADAGDNAVPDLNGDGDAAEEGTPKSKKKRKSNPRRTNP